MGGLGYAEDSAADIACCESAVRGGGSRGGRLRRNEASRVLSSDLGMGTKEDIHQYLSQRVKDGNL